MDAYYPVFLKVAGKKAVVIGGGPVAARKAATLASAGALVTVISPVLCPELEAMLASGTILHERRAYAPGGIEGAALVIAATDDPAVNAEACRASNLLGIPSNSVRPPDAGNFIVPSTIKRGGLTIAVSTGGGCPALSKRIRKDLEAFIGDEYGPFLEFLEEARAALKEHLPEEAARAGALTDMVESGLIDTFRDSGPDTGLAAGRAALAGLLARRPE